MRGGLLGESEGTCEWQVNKRFFLENLALAPRNRGVQGKRVSGSQEEALTHHEG